MSPVAASTVGVYAFHDGGKASGAPGRQFNLPRKVAGRDKAPVTVSVTNSVLTGNDTAGSYGLWAEGTGSVQLVASNCAVTHWDQGLHLEEFGGTVGGEAHNCVIRDNVTYGGWSNTITPYDATDNWWGGATGPFHPTLNPTGLGNEVSDNILFDPFRDGNVVFVPDPQMIGLDDDAGGGYYRDQVVCHYLGGGSGPVYGYSIDVTWDPLVIAASPGDFSRPDTGPFATANFFFVQAIPNGSRQPAADRFHA
jgi:hypothetical protein